MRSFTTCNSYQCLGYHAKKEVDGACGKYVEEYKCTGFWWEYLNDRENLQDLGLDWKVISKRTLQKQNGSELNLCGEGEGQMTGCCEHSNEISCSMLEGEFIY
jgi:hypothetical protein